MEPDIKKDEPITLGRFRKLSYFTLTQRVKVVSSFSGRVICTHQNINKERYQKYMSCEVVDVQAILTTKEDFCLPCLKITIQCYDIEMAELAAKR